MTTTKTSPRQQLAPLFIRIGLGLKKIRLRGFSAIAVGPTQRDAIHTVANRPGLTQADLVRRLGVDRAVGSQLVCRLVSTGVLAFEPTLDRRSKGLLHLTPYGRAISAGLGDEADDLEFVVRTQLSESETRALEPVLQRIVAAVDHVLALPPDGEIPPMDISGIRDPKGL